jgi:inhibitor of KinA
MEITPLGDSALILRMGDQLQDASEQTVNQVLGAMHRIERAQLPGIIELAPAYTTLAVYFDPVRVIDGGADPGDVVDWLTKKLNDALGKSRRLRRDKSHVRAIEVPICCDTEFALDLEEVARHAKLSPAEVVDLYCAGTYCVGCIGFTPGFPYLLGLPQKLATPRRASPRKDVPAGSVAIGGEQTGIYPLRSPGGWNLIGRTPLQLFDPQNNPPALLNVGDRIRFRAIARDEFGPLKVER